MTAAPVAKSSGAAAGQLAVAPLVGLLWRTCAQTTASVGVYGVYALTNAWFVGQGVGDQAMAAVNLTSPLLLLLGAVATTVGAGGASLVSRALGAGDPGAAARAAGNAMLLFLCAAATTTVLGLLFLDPLLNAFGAHGELHEPARQYAVVLLCGSVVSTGFSSLVRAEGRIGFSTLLWVLAVAVQIALDPLLIMGLDMGVRGAALGTVGGQAVSAAMSWWFFFGQRVRPYHIGLLGLRPHAATLRALLGVGLPSFLAGTGVTLLAFLVNTTLAAAGSATALAAYAVCARLQTFVAMPHTGISQGLQPIVGYNAGCGLPHRVTRARTLALRACVLYGLTAAALLWSLAEPLAGLFLSDAHTAGEAGRALRVIALGQAVAGIAPLATAYFQAVGRPTPAYVLSIGTLLAVKAPLVLALGYPCGTDGVWLALAVGELATAAVALLLLWRSRA